MNRLLLFAAALLFAVSCSQKSSSALISGNITGAAEKDIVISQLIVNQIKVLDTIKTSKTGEFKYKVQLKDDSPNFYYISYKRTKLASLLIYPNDKVNLQVDTLGKNLTVQGSEETLLLTKIEKDFSSTLDSFESIASKLEAALNAKDEERAKELRQEMGRVYVKHKQNAIKSIIKNPYSFTNVSVLYQYITPTLPVFAQETDRMYIKNVYDSLYIKYPSSMYVKSLKSLLDEISVLQEFNSKVADAAETAFPNISLPDINAKEVELASLMGRPFILLFWSSADVKQKIFNNDLKDLYSKYNKLGLEIYQVEIGIDKTAWATAVKEQALPWINVCDGKGTDSRVVTLYQIAQLPTLFLFNKDGDMVAKNIFDKSVLDKEIAKIVK